MERKFALCEGIPRVIKHSAADLNWKFYGVARVEGSPVSTPTSHSVEVLFSRN
jgi:hypothetical protein